MNLLRELVEIETVNPPGTHYEEFTSVMRDRFRELGFQVELVEIPDEFLDKNYIYSPRHRGNKRVILLARNDPEPRLHFNFHYDVVPAGNGWVTDPFKLKVVDDRAYGRGTSDMKGPSRAFTSRCRVKTSPWRLPLYLMRRAEGSEPGTLWRNLGLGRET